MMSESLIVVRSLECEKCGRFDSLVFSQDDIKKMVGNSDIGIASWAVDHRDHRRIIYFNLTGEYQGDSLVLDLESELESGLNEIENVKVLGLGARTVSSIPKKERSGGFLSKLRQKLSQTLFGKDITLAIVGPSRAGKSCLLNYLENQMPDESLLDTDTLPTMGRSKKNIELGNSRITAFDMGGQEGFWDIWDSAIEPADAIIYVIDGATSNHASIIESFLHVLSLRSKDIPILIVINKIDIYLRGISPSFLTTNRFIKLLPSSALEQVGVFQIIQASILTGFSYSYESNELIKIPLLEIISNFLSSVTD
jgi:small GTP-binding protein